MSDSDEIQRLRQIIGELREAGTAVNRVLDDLHDSSAAVHNRETCERCSAWYGWIKAAEPWLDDDQFIEPF